MAATAQERTQEQILEIIVRQDDVSWKQVIFGLIETEQMDPWDIDISRLSQRFIVELKRFKEMDFRISGKVVLASAILLKLKAEKLHDEEVAALDSLINAVEQPDEFGLDALEQPMDMRERVQLPKLTPRTPQPRQRKVSVYDLIEALEQALDTQARRPPVMVARTLDTIEPPQHHIDISEIIREVYEKVHAHYEKDGQPQGSLQFSHLLKSEDPRDKVMAFIPLLHLENARKVEMEQRTHFGPITIHLRDTTPLAAYAPAQENAGGTQAVAREVESAAALARAQAGKKGAGKPRRGR